MDRPRRATVYFDPELHRALRIRASEGDRTISDLVNDAVRHQLAEDADDYATFKDRAGEPDIPIEKVLRDLKARGKL